MPTHRDRENHWVSEISEDQIIKSINSYNENKTKFFTVCNIHKHNNVKYILSYKEKFYEAYAILKHAYFNMPHHDDQDGKKRKELRCDGARVEKRLLDLRFNVFSRVGQNENYGNDDEDSRETDGERKSKYRKEQDILCKKLGIKKESGETHECAICGRILPTEFIEAAHIKKRSSIFNNIERWKVDVVMPACKLGCHVLFDAGYISINEYGDLVAFDVVENNDIMNNCINNIAIKERKKLKIWKSSKIRQQYFKEHFQFWTEQGRIPRLT